jgi:MoaA/NifB/PqqE/SkfB family radical SAM enzyme
LSLIGERMSITRRIDAVTGISAAYLREAPPAPKSVKIELTGRCNYACKFCALRTREEQPSEDMDFALFQRVTAEMHAAGVQEIGLFYLGESFVNPDLLVRACEWVKQELRFPYVFLTSNASLARPDQVERLMRARLDSLKWSVNAADPEQFKRLMGVKPALFRSALANIRAAHEVRERGGYRTGLYASSIRYDGEQQRRMEALLAEHVIPYVDEHYWLPLYSMAMRSGELRQKLGYTPMHGNSGRYDPKTGLPTRAPLPCWSVFTEGHVRCDGHMSACCFGSDDRFDVGDLRTQSFVEVWNGGPMRRIRAAQIRTQTEGPKALKGTICDVCVAYS